LIISRPFLLTIRNVSEKICTEAQNTHFVLSNIFFENRAVYEIMWKNIVERGRPQIVIWRMRIACRIPKATNTHSECLVLTDFPLQQWSRERASTLRHTHIACIVFPLCPQILSVCNDVSSIFVPFAIAITHIHTLITVIYRQVS